MHNLLSLYILWRSASSRAWGGGVRAWGGTKRGTVSFHNFKSQNFKLSVSNPKNKYVAYLSVLSQISNCQSLGRKNKHDILKTDRMLQRGTYGIRKSHARNQHQHFQKSLGTPLRYGLRFLYGNLQEQTREHGFSKKTTGYLFCSYRNLRKPPETSGNSRDNVI